MFNLSNCYSQSVYCGDKEKKFPYIENDIKYISNGSSFQCLKKGFGAGIFQSLKKNISKNSLLNIKYVGTVFEKKFKRNKIYTISSLLNFSRKSKKNNLKILLEKVFTDSTGRLYINGYNSVLLFLYRNGLYNNLPSCKIIYHNINE